MKAIFDIIKSAGQLAIEEQKKMTTETKKDGTIVTNGDIAVSKFLECELSKLFPDYEVFSEESCDILPKGSKVIVLDPIDGTKSYHRYEDTWCILVGFLENMKPTKGFVYQPTTQKMFYAEKNKGAFLQLPSGEEFSLRAQGNGPFSAVKSLKNYGESEFFKEHQIDLVSEMYSAALKILKVASGENDLYANFQKGCSVWDLVAPQCILEEAGGRLEFAQPIEWDLKSPLLPERFCAIGARGQEIMKYDWRKTEF
jgi:3'(2'), 5'-bisphosphate nucleotidase